jgi:transcriptional regulator NrdR family protein
VESDRIDRKFERVDEKLDTLDERIDRLEISQGQQTSKLDAIHSIQLANNEVLEEKLNRIGAVSEIRFDEVKRNFLHFEQLVIETLKFKG